MAEKIYINNDWKYTEEYGEKLLQWDFDEDGMEQVRLPHTCKETPYHYFDESTYQMVSGYRKWIFVPEEWSGKSVRLTFEGVAHAAEVYLNGEKMAEHHCGYTAFTVELGEKLKIGEQNLITVKVDSRESLNIPPFGYAIDYMTFGGIYRDAYLEITEKVYLKDVFVTARPKKQAAGIVCAQVTIEGEFPERTGGLSNADSFLRMSDAGYVLRQSLRRRTTGQADEEEYRQIWEVPVAAQVTKQETNVGQIDLWDVDSPVLYEVKTELLLEGRVLDEKVVTCGFREAVFRRDGFYLNGRKLKLRGLNRHQSYPYVGYAMPESMQKLDADILKNELGVNAVRTSHYPQSHYFLNRCDEIGLLVFTEMPGWQHIGNEEWKLQAIENVKDMVIQYRNHTSIILWGVRINESQDDDDFYRRTNAAAHELDPYRQTGGVRAGKKSSLLEDVYTYNDFVHDGKQKGCEPKAAVTSDTGKPYLISEYNGHMFPTKAFDNEERKAEHAIRHANVLDAVAAQEDIAGCFGWCMFDYNTHKDFGSGDRICYHGVMDMFRNAKPAAAIYASQQEKTPILEISSSMDIGEHPGCNRGMIYLFTNADSVRMYKNDRFIKEYRREDSQYRHLKHGPIVVDDFLGDTIEKLGIYKPAQAKAIKDLLNAVARFGMTGIPKKLYWSVLKLLTIYHMKMEQAVELYTAHVGDWGGTATTYRFEALKDGKVVRTITKEPMKKAHLQISVSQTELVEQNTYDVAAVRIKAIDEHENLLCFGAMPVELSTEGAIEIIGPKLITLQGGMSGTYIKSKGISGKGTLIVRAAQMEEIRQEFTVETAE